MRVLGIIARVIIGLVFIFSGFVKAVDPLGTAYKLEEYFAFMHLSGLSEFSLILSVLLITLEFLIGFSLVFNLLPKFMLIVVSVLMVIFTLETLYLAIYNPISDCGCFGDAIKLTNWQTFYKNVILDVLLIIVWLSKVMWKKEQNVRNSLGYLFIVAFAIVLFQIYNLLCLPVIDFRPYKIGTDLKKAISQKDSIKYETILIYRNKQTSELKEFTEQNYPWQDTLNWEFVDMKVNEIIVYKSELGDFVITNESGKDVTDSIVNLSGNVYFIVINDISKAKTKQLKKVLTYSLGGHRFILTSSDPTKVKQKLNNLTTSLPEILLIDATELKTIIRSNVGIIQLYNGKIINKQSATCL